LSEIEDERSEKREMRKKNKQEREGKWKEMSGGLMQVTGMNEWIAEHPHATLEETEKVLDERMSIVRAQMLEDAISEMGRQESWKDAPKEKRPKCERCGAALIARGKRTRFLQTSGGEQVKIERSYTSCPDCGQGFFSLMSD
jgi:ribosomal protein S27AE